jgi:hypothetical protein
MKREELRAKEGLRMILPVNLASIVDSGHVNQMLLEIDFKYYSQFSLPYSVKSLPIALELFGIHRNRLAFHSLKEAEYLGDGFCPEILLF